MKLKDLIEMLESSGVDPESEVRVCVILNDISRTPVAYDILDSIQTSMRTKPTDYSTAYGGANAEEILDSTKAGDYDPETYETDVLDAWGEPKLLLHLVGHGGRVW